MESTKRDWKKVVSESNGSSVFVPDSLVEQAKKWSESRDEFNTLINGVAEKENTLKVKFTNLMYEIQKYFADNGRPEIWSMDMGFDTNALKEGQFVVNIQEPRKM